MDVFVLAPRVKVAPTHVPTPTPAPTVHAYAPLKRLDGRCLTLD